MNAWANQVSIEHEDVREEARAHARARLRGHRGILRALSPQRREAIARIDTSDTVGRKGPIERDD